MGLYNTFRDVPMVVLIYILMFSFFIIIFFLFCTDKDLMHCIVSLSMATSLEDDLVSSPSAGYLCM